MNQHFEPFLTQLRHDLQQELPGRAAQYRMAPRPRPGGELFDKPEKDPRRGGVLILFYPKHNEPYLPLILRPTYSGVHSGQVGLPGGGYEEIDDDMTATALREAYEEIGIRPAAVTILGALSTLYVYASNYMVHPIVGWTDFRPEFHPDPYEVAKLLEVRLADLLDPATKTEEEWQLRNRQVMVPYFTVQNQVVWGATAMILSELLQLPAVRQLQTTT